MTKKINRLMVDFDESWYRVELPISKKILEVKPYNLKANKSLAMSMEEAKVKNDMKILLNGVVNIISSSIKPDENGKIMNVSELHVADFVFLSNKLKSITKGSMVKYNVQCDNLEYKENEESELGPCKHENLIEFDIDNFEIINPEQIDELKINVGNKDYIFYLKQFTIDMIFENPAIISNAKTIEGILILLSSFVESISMGEKIYDDLTIDEVYEFIVNLTENQVKPLVEWFQNITRLVLKKEFICEKCKKKQEIVIDDMLSHLE